MRTVNLRAEDIIVGDLLNFGGARRERVSSFMRTKRTDADGNWHGAVTLFSKAGRMVSFNIDDEVPVGRSH